MRAWSRPRCRAVLASAISLHLLAHCGTVPDDAGFVPIFDGETLTDWRAVPEDLGAAWSVQDGAIQGAGLEKRLSYLVYSADEELSDFELRLSYRMLTDGNTGVELRARADTTGKRPFEGYHADLGHVGIGPQILGAWDFHFATRTEFPCERGTRLIIDETGAGLHQRIEDRSGSKISGSETGTTWELCTKVRNTIAHGSGTTLGVTARVSVPPGTVFTAFPARHPPVGFMITG